MTTAGTDPGETRRNGSYATTRRRKPSKRIRFAEEIAALAAAGTAVNVFASIDRKSAWRAAETILSENAVRFMLSAGLARKIRDGRSARGIIAWTGDGT